VAGFKGKGKLQTFLDLVRTSTSIAFPEDKLRLIFEKLTFRVASGGNALKNDRPLEKVDSVFFPEQRLY
jgi:hypothetical protein